MTGKHAKAEEPQTLWDNLKRLALVMFSVPAAVGLLDKYDEALGLSDLLKRIVRNYEAVTELIWGHVGRIVSLPPDFDTAFWSFFVLILTPVLAEMTRNALADKRINWGRPGFWGLASAIAFLGYTAAFAVTAEIGLALLDLVAFLVVFLPLGMIVGFGIPEILGGAGAPRWRKWLSTLLTAGALLAIVLSAGVLSDWLFAGLYARLGITPAAGIRDIAILISMASAVVFAYGNLRAPAYVFFWALGLWLIDTLASNVLPAVTAVLDDALPPTTTE